MKLSSNLFLILLKERLELLAPRYWLFWIGFLFLRTLSILPYGCVKDLGRIFGKILYCLLKKRVKVAQVNLKKVFPNLSPEKQKKLLEAHFASLGMGIFESCWMLWGSAKRLRQWGRIHGLDRLDTVTEKQGVILLFPHVSMVALMIRFFGVLYQKPFAFMYRRLDHPCLQWLLECVIRKHPHVTAIQKNQIKKMVEVLQKKQMVIYLPDQDIDRQYELVPFLGIQTATSTAPRRMCELTGAAVMWVDCDQKSAPFYYEITIHEPFQSFPSEYERYDIRRINVAIEEAIQKQPEHYLWVHRRFKKRPIGEASFYEE